MNNYPIELKIAINKAKTVSWRLGIAWTLVAENGEVLTCNGKLFNQHNRELVADLKKYSDARRMYVSYCPILDELYSDNFLDALRLSNLSELHIYASEGHKNAISCLTEKTTIPLTLWPSDHEQNSQDTGIAWIRSTRRPWIHIVCSNSLGGGVFPIQNMCDQLGVLSYITLKGMESSSLYIQYGRNYSLGIKLKIANPIFVEKCDTLVQDLSNLYTASVSLVTIVCDQDWLAKIVKMGLANEVSYFLSLRSTTVDASSLSSAIEFPEQDKWNINSSEVMGDFMQIVLQKGLSMHNKIDREDLLAT